MNRIHREKYNMKKKKLRASIHCPKHGLQPSNNDAGYAVACIKCYPEKKNYKLLGIKK